MYFVLRCTRTLRSFCSITTAGSEVASSINGECPNYTSESPRANGTRVDISLLLVCRAISEEAIEAFFDVNTIRANSFRLFAKSNFTRVKHLELMGRAANQFACLIPTNVPHLIDILEPLTNIKSVTVASDHTGNADEIANVRNSITGGSPEIEACYIDVGIFEVRAPLRLDRSGSDSPGMQKLMAKGICFKYFALRDVLRAALTLLARYSLDQLLEMCWAVEWDEETRVWNLERGALWTAIWLLKYEAHQAWMKGNDPVMQHLTGDKQFVVEQFAKDDLYTSTSVPWKHPSLPPDVKLLDLLEHPTSYSSELLEWASELLRLNCWLPPQQDLN